MKTPVSSAGFNWVVFHPLHDGYDEHRLVLKPEESMYDVSAVRAVQVDCVCVVYYPGARLTVFV